MYCWCTFVAESGRFGASFAVDGDGSVRYMVAMYSYNPIELSPNIDADVSDVLMACVHGKMMCCASL